MATTLRNARLLAPALFVVGGTCQYLGAAIGVFLFDTVDPAAVAWLRAAGAAVVLLAWRRPDVRSWPIRRLVVAGVFGLVTTGMNVLFYEAIHRIPLGAAVAIEFLGPVAIAAAGSRRARDVLAVVLVVAGVVAIASAQFGVGNSGADTSIAGAVWALGAAAFWAGYIVLGKSVADAGSGMDDLAVGMAVAAVLLAPVLIAPELVGNGSALLEPRVWLLGVGVGVLSSVIPYVLDQVVLAREGRARFAVLLALLPTTATVVGAVVLAQLPSTPELFGIAAVVVAVLVSGTSTVAPDPPLRTDGSSNKGCDMTDPADTLVHMCTLGEWLSARRAGEHRPDSLIAEGFIHLSSGRQVHLPANRLFHGRTDLVLLSLDPQRLGSPIRWEPGVPSDPESMLFPHLYGPLPSAAVTAVADYRPTPDGSFAAWTD